MKLRDKKLDALDTKLAGMAETLVFWLDENHAYTALQIYFLCGVLQALIKEGWRDETPPLYMDLVEMLDLVGAVMGPMIAAVELDGLPAAREQVSCERQRKSRKQTVN